MKRRIYALITALVLTAAPVCAAVLAPQTAITAEAAAVKLKTKKLKIAVGESGTIYLKNKTGHANWFIARKFFDTIKLSEVGTDYAVITGLSAGTARVKVTAGGKTMTCKVTVTGSNNQNNGNNGDNGSTVIPAGAIDVTTYGATPDDATEDNKAIEQAIWDAKEAGGGTVYIPAGTYRISINEAAIGIQMRSNVTLIMDKNTVLEVEGTSADWYNVIYISNESNVTVKGGRINGERNSHKGSDGEDGCGVGILDSKNVTIENMNINSNWGDGIYLGTNANSNGGCSGITIKNCEISKNRRNNIAIVYASNVTIDGCKISDAYGAKPQCGINIEPNKVDGRLPVLKNITISNTEIRTHAEGTLDGNFWCFQTIYHDDKGLVTCDGVTIKNCRFYGIAGNFSGKNFKIVKSTINKFYDNPEMGTSIDGSSKINR